MSGDHESEEEAPERRGLPDLAIHNDDGWAVAFECKIAAKLAADQLRRHRRTLEKRGFSSPQLAVLDVRENISHGDASVISIAWPDVYAWARGRDSWWAQTLADYLEIEERRMIESGYLEEGTLTRFSGIPFGPDRPYNYLEAKRLLRLVMKDLRKRKALATTLGADLEAEGRSAITGSAGQRVWDLIPLKAAREDALHTKCPHLSFDIGVEDVRTYISVPNAVPAAMRRRLLEGGEGSFREMLASIVQGLHSSLGSVAGAAPFVFLTQRRYPSQRAQAIADAVLTFDPRTVLPENPWPGKPRIKYQPQWLAATYAALAAKKSNLHFSIGVHFPYARCPALARPDAVRLFADAWLGCAPLLRRTVG